MELTKTIYIIDCSYYFRASYFALPPIYSPNGTLVNAVYGFLSTLIKLIKNHHPTALVIADDTHGRYFRHTLFPSYKSGKKHVPEECNKQIPILRKIIDTLSIPYFTYDGFEADDIIATLSFQAQQKGLQTVICSRDKDLKQLLNDKTVILDISTDKETTVEVLKKESGILPSQIPDFLALIGDKADSIPGIPGIGSKTATKLLNQYGSLESIIDTTEELETRLKPLVRKYREQAVLAKKIICLRTDVPITYSIESLFWGFPDKINLYTLMQELGLNTLIKRFELVFQFI